MRSSRDMNQRYRYSTPEAPIDPSRTSPRPRGLHRDGLKARSAAAGAGPVRRTRDRRRARPGCLRHGQAEPNCLPCARRATCTQARRTTCISALLRPATPICRLRRRPTRPDSPAAPAVFSPARHNTGVSSRATRRTRRTSRSRTFSPGRPTTLLRASGTPGWIAVPTEPSRVREPPSADAAGRSSDQTAAAATTRLVTAARAPAISVPACPGRPATRPGTPVPRRRSPRPATGTSPRDPAS
jgi:hypothetical protein